METDTVRTCQNCAHAKIRCNRSRPEGSCDRCQRLDKECVFRPARRRLNAPPREPRSDGLASIEAKLDHLISLHASPQPTLTGSRTATPDACDVVDAGAVTFQAAEYYVELYKSTLTPHFPFVVLPQDTSAQQLRREKPLLFLAVLASAAYGDVAVQRDLAMRMRNVIAEYLAGRGSMSFELLQALLVHLAWSQYHPKPKRYSQYLQLAVSIIVDQRLDRHPRTRRWKTHVGASAEEHFDEAQPPYASRSPDVQRAVAGCYYLSSSISTLLQKLNTFQCNTYIEDCCKSLSAEPKFPTDKYLHSIIYLQRITESIDPPSDLENMAARPSAGTATSNFEHFHSTISSFEVNVPFHVSDSDMVMMLYHTVRLHNVQMRLSASGTESGAFPDSHAFTEGFQAASYLLNSFLNFPLRTEMALNNSEWLQLSFALTVAAKLVFAATDPSVGQEIKRLRDSLGLSSILRQLVRRLGALSSPVTDDQGQPDIFYGFEQRVRRMQTWFEDRYARAQEGAQHTSQTEKNDGAYPMPIDGGLLLPVSQGLEGMAAYDLELSAIFFPDLRMEDSWGDWTTYSGGF